MQRVYQGLKESKWFVGVSAKEAGGGIGGDGERGEYLARNMAFVDFGRN